MKIRGVVYLVCTTLAVIVFVGSGIANLLRAEHVAADMLRLGYPAYFMTVLGTWKVLGSITIAVPRLPRAKEWAYTGMMLDLSGAAASRAALGDGIETVLVPLVIAGFVVASWALRPPGRVLGGSDMRAPEEPR